MIALYSGPVVFVVFPNAFGRLVDRLLPELSHTERIGFKSAGGNYGVSEGHEHQDRVPEWERLFLERLHEKMLQVRDLLTFDLKEPREIGLFLPDVLAGHRASRQGAFAFSIDEVGAPAQRVVTLVEHHPPAHPGAPPAGERERLVVPLAEVKRVAGTSAEFELTTLRGFHRFTLTGLRHGDD